MDNDAKMLELMGTALTTLQIKYRASKLSARTKLKPELESLTRKYTTYQLRLLRDGVITTDEDLAEMEELRKAINTAARKQKLAVAIAKTAAFVASKMA